MSRRKRDCRARRWQTRLIGGECLWSAALTPHKSGKRCRWYNEEEFSSKSDPCPVCIGWTQNHDYLVHNTSTRPRQFLVTLRPSLLRCHHERAVFVIYTFGEVDTAAAALGMVAGRDETLLLKCISECRHPKAHYLNKQHGTTVWRSAVTRHWPRRRQFGSAAATL